MSAKFDEFPSLPFQDIKEKPKHHGQMGRRMERRMERRMDGHVKTVYLPTNIVCGGIIIKYFPIWCNVNFVSVFTALNNTKKQRNFNITPYGEKFYQLTYWDKI